ncbi:hypothetical protein AB2M62_12510 [Sphingomonas sp. MMS12-HWE2-04]|uniref:hypothetical protein n=1 Tax=Sphingomonas sp. MMS12-HWE2-04 TaxID=3234199 RepID=UPI00384F1B1E
MYRFLDRAVRDLAPGEQVLTWAMRSWVCAMASQRCPCAALGPAFARWRVGDLLADFNMTMFLLNQEGQSALKFAQPLCGLVRDDEARLLALFHAAAAKDKGLLTRAAAQFVLPEAEPPFRIAIAGAADVLRRVPVPRNS